MTDQQTLSPEAWQEALEDALARATEERDNLARALSRVRASLRDAAEIEVGADDVEWIPVHVVTAAIAGEGK